MRVEEWSAFTLCLFLHCYPETKLKDFPGSAAVGGILVGGVASQTYEVALLQGYGWQSGYLVSSSFEGNGILGRVGMGGTCPRVWNGSASLGFS